MKLKQSVIALSIIGLLAGTPILSVASDMAVSASHTVKQAKQNQPLSDEEVSSLTFMREEEKLARDVYRVMFDEWENPIFYNISQSEQQHMDTMKSLLDKYGLADPVIDDSTGAFVDHELDELYTTLIDDGLVGPAEALRVGALIEEVDIEDIQIAIEAATHADLIRAYENLMRGSRNHLRAFVGQIESQGVEYEAVVLDQDVVDAIVDSPVERGGPARGGRGGR